MNDADNTKIADFKHLIRLLELERQTLAKAEAREGLQAAFSVLLKHLNHFSSAEILSLYPRHQSKPPTSGTKQLPSEQEL